MTRPIAFLVPTLVILALGFTIMPAAEQSKGLSASTGGKRGTVSGRVLDREGRPATNAEVLVYSGTQFEKKVATDADGRYAIGDLPPGRYHLKARKDRSFTLRLPGYDIEIGDGSVANVALSLVTGGTIELTVVDRDTKKPVRGARAWFDCHEPGKRTTDEKGIATIFGFDYDTVDFQVNAERYARQIKHSYHSVSTVPGEVVKTTVELAPERTITGMVTDAGGRALSDAVVTIDSRWQGRWGTGRLDLDPALTDRKGAFRLGGLAEGEYTYRLTATKEGFAPGRASVDFRKMSGVRIALHVGATVGGTVKNAKGVPVSEATVMLGEGISTLTDAQGRWEVEHVEAETYAISGEKGELASKPRELAVGLTDRLDDVHLVLKKKEKAAFDVSGIVVDAIDGKPIPRVRLRFWSIGDRDETKTDEEGRFHFPDIPVGERRLYFPGMPKRYIDPMVDVEFSVVDRDIDDLVIKLPRAATIEGRVLLPSGEAAWEAKIRVLHPKSKHTSRLRRQKIQTDSQGRFTAREIPPGMCYRVRAELAGYAPVVSEPFHVRQGDRVEGLTVRLHKPGVLKGVIKDGNGMPLSEGVWLTANFPDVEDAAWNNSWISGQVRPDATGRFEIEGLPPGEVTVQVMREGRGLDGSAGWTGRVLSRSIGIVSGETISVELVIAGAGPATSAKPKKLGGRIAGRVVGIQNGEGIPGIDVYAIPKDRHGPDGRHGKTKTGPDGTFRIENIKEGDFQVRANPGQAGGYDLQDLESVLSPSDDIPIVLRRLCVIEGSVIDKNSGKPVGEFTIGEVGARPRPVRNREGRFRLEGLQRGSCLLRAVSDGVGVAQKRFELREGETVDNALLVLHEPWSIQGRVVRGKDGLPIKGATVTTLSLDRDSKSKSTTDSEGRFQIAGVYPGKETLFVEHPHYGKPWFEGIEIPETLAGQETVLRLKEPAAIKGRVFFEGDLPYEGETLRLELSDGGYSRLFKMAAITDHEGWCDLSPIPPGRYTVVWRLEDPEIGRGGYWGQTLELESGQTVHVEFGGGAAVLTGTVIEKGWPKYLAVITITAEGVKRWVQTDEQGRYRILGLEPGAYDVVLTVPGQRENWLGKKHIDLPAQGEVLLNFDYDHE